MTQTIKLKDIIRMKQEAEEMADIIRRCEDIQNDDSVCDYHKERAKAIAYDELVKIFFEGR